MNLKKCTSLLLVFLLLVSNTGFAFNVHFCGGQVASVSLKADFQKTEKGCCGMTVEKSHCCKSKVVHFQKKSDNTVVKTFAFQSDIALSVEMIKLQPITENPISKSENKTNYFCDAHAPPLFKLYSQYIFYDNF